VVTAASQVLSSAVLKELEGKKTRRVVRKKSKKKKRRWREGEK